MYDHAIPMTERPLVFTDLETTGLSAQDHEIIELGAVITTPDLEVIGEIDYKIRPEHIENAQPEALAVNGYRAEDWGGAIALGDALYQYGKSAENAMFVAHNPTFDWPFVQEGFRKAGIESPLDYHRIDTFTMAWFALRKQGLDRFNQDNVSAHLGIPVEARPHRAINGARQTFAVYKRLIELA